MLCASAVAPYAIDANHTAASYVMVDLLVIVFSSADRFLIVGKDRESGIFRASTQRLPSAPHLIYTKYR